MNVLHRRHGGDGATCSIMIFRIFLLLIFAVSSAPAGLVFHTTTNSFTNAVTALAFRGVEDWSSATAAAADSVADPLRPGLANGPFGTGSSIIAGVVAHANLLGTNATNFGLGLGMFYTPAGSVGVSGNVQPSKQLATSDVDDSFDLILTNYSLPRAVSLSPMFYRITGGTNARSVTVKVFNQANVLLGTSVVTNVQDCLENAYLGMLATGDDRIMRINLAVPPGDLVGADNIRVYDDVALPPPIVFYGSNAFNAAVSSFIFRGVEDWSGATGTADAVIPDPLLPGVTNGPFPTGSSTVTAIRVQSNSRLTLTATTNFGAGLFYAPAGFQGTSGNLQPSKQLSVNRTNQSFDLVFSPDLPGAVSLSPMFYRLQGGNNSRPVTVKVYNHENALLGSTNVPSVQDCLENAFAGIIVSAHHRIGRINVATFHLDVAGADNIRVYDAPLAPPSAPTLSSVSRSGNNFTFQLNGQSGVSYAILTSTNLTNWQSVQTNSLVNTNSTSISVTIAGARNFYRAQVVP
jgi:hypothetical protein